jgi:GWxTD domain-containing protein
MVSQRLARALAAAAVLSWLAVPAPAAAGASLRAWRDGPVRLLLTPEEYERFGGLDTDDGRRAFIEEFWREVDAAPDGGGRNFRATFERRCAVADERYPTIHVPGWRTDRGRVYILLGEPKAIRHESAGLKAVDKEVWVYDGAGDPEGGLEVAFYRCRDGSYRTDPSCPVVGDTSSVAFDWERSNYIRALQISNLGLPPSRVRQLLTELLTSLARTTPSAPRKPDPAAAPPKSIDDGAVADGRLDVVPYYFRAQDGTVLVFVTLALDEDPAAAPPEAPVYLAAASFAEVDGRGAGVAGSAIHTMPLETVVHDGRPPTFFGRAYLAPGRRYAARYAVRDDRRGETFVRDERLTVPDLGSGLSASSLVLAERFGPAGDEAGRYQVGSEEVVPRVGASFRRSELLRLYLQVYGAAVDPERNTPRVDVVFRFQRIVGGSSKRFGKPFSVREAAGAAMGLALPIGDWPPGPYRVRVELHDRVAGERLSVEGAFHVVED